MAKRRTVFACQKCGAQQPKWLGRCPECGGWDTLVEEIPFEEAPAADERSDFRTATRERARPRRLQDVGGETIQRLGTGVGGLDAVLGGGLVPGSLVLVSGEPGAGKSTLLLQAAAGMAAEGPVLYVSGEESEGQVKMRAERLGAAAEELFIYAETELERVVEAVKNIRPRVLIVDSVQTSFSSRFSSAPGSVTQVRETASGLLGLAKGSGMPVLLIGHVNKEGQIAGPKTMEHIVDTVAVLDGERSQAVRMLRALKNRFGPVSETAVFEMVSSGLREVANPSELFLAERAAGASGSAVTATVEGTRPLLVEVQALLSPIAYGSGRRTAEGFDHNRLALLLAILERRGGLAVAANDVFVNVVGGVRLGEPAVDLAVAAALASSLLDRPLPEDAVLFGEVGLGGEVRSVSAADLRVREAAAIGMKHCYLPARAVKSARGRKGITLHGVENIVDLLDMLWK